MASAYQNKEVTTSRCWYHPVMFMLPGSVLVLLTRICPLPCVGMGQPDHIDCVHCAVVTHTHTLRKTIHVERNIATRSLETFTQYTDANNLITDLANSTIVSGVNVYSLYKLFNENKPTTASQIKAGKDALREALDILHRALMDGLPIPQKEVHILTRKHETLLLFCDKFEKSAAERFSFNLHHIFVQPFTDNHKARSFNAQCHELLYLTQRSSDISRLRSIKGILQDSQFDESATLTTWSMVLNPESPSKGTDGGSSTTLVRCSNDVVPNKSGSTPSLLRVLEFNPWRESDDESGSSDMALRSEN